MGRVPNPIKQWRLSSCHTRAAESDVQHAVVVNKKKRPVRNRTGLFCGKGLSVSAQPHGVADSGAEGNQAGCGGEGHDR